jgi:membrane associated rhomboid family serine protease
MLGVSGAPSISVSIVVLLVAVTALVSVAAWASKSLRSAFVLNPYVVRKRGQVYRLLTAGFIHADAMHLLFNMLTLWFFANGVVRILGVPRFLVLYLGAVIVGFVPTTLRYMRQPAYNSLGASGAVAAVTFSAIALQPGLRVGIPFVPVLVPGIVYGVLYLAYSAWHSYRARDGINHDAHFTGAIFGALLTYAFEPARVQRALGHLI